MALQINDKKEAKKVKPEPEKKVVAEAAEVNEAVAVEEAEGEVSKDGVRFGSARGDLAFLQPLGNPADPDTTRIDLDDGTKGKKVTSTIVGYKFKVLKDMMVPDCGTTEDMKKDLMCFVDPNKWVPAKAGDIIKLTPFETALLLSQPQFNGGCDGGEKPVICVYQNRAIKTKKGEVSKVSAMNRSPRVSLRAAAANGSIKDFDIEDVLTYEKVTINGVVRKKCTLKEGFEKWAPLAASTVRRSTSGERTGRSVKNSANIANKNAQAFLAFVASVGKKAN